MLNLENFVLYTFLKKKIFTDEEIRTRNLCAPGEHVVHYATVDLEE